MNGERTNNLSDFVRGAAIQSRAHGLQSWRHPTGTKPGCRTRLFFWLQSKSFNRLLSVVTFKCVRGIIRCVRCILFSILKYSSDWFSQCSAKNLLHANPTSLTSLSVRWWKKGSHGRTLFEICVDFTEVNLKVMQNQCVVVSPCRVMLAVLNSWAEPLRRSEARTSHSKTICLSFHHPVSVQSSRLQPNGSGAGIHVGADELRCVSQLVADASLTSYFCLCLCSLSRVTPPLPQPPAFFIHLVCKYWLVPGVNVPVPVSS